METFTYNGSEASLYNLLIWWNKMVSFEHSDDCQPEPGVMHCCEGKPSKSNAIIGSEGRMVRREDPIPIYFEFLKGKRAGERYNVHPGDMFLFEDGKFSYKEWYECVVISQDWP